MNILNNLQRCFLYFWCQTSSKNHRALEFYRIRGGFMDLGDINGTSDTQGLIHQKEGP